MTSAAETAVTYPPIQPYSAGMLPVGDGHEVYWETSGNPDGQPVVFLHGGPGGGSSPAHRQLFDPARYRIVLLDQRGCGRSTPHASTAGAGLSANTTWHLVADLERLRLHLGITSWHVFGGSWGSTLALAYAQQHRDRVRSLVLRGIFTARRTELDWLFGGGARALFPEAWEAFTAPVPAAERGDYIGAYHRLLNHPDPTVHGPAAVAWSTWEATVVTLLPDPQMIAQFAQPDFALAFARIENHYFTHRCWLAEGQLLGQASQLDDIPAVIVQGRYDACTPPVTAWELAQAWPQARLQIVPDAGHAVTEPGILQALITATDEMAALGSPSP